MKEPLRFVCIIIKHVVATKRDNCLSFLLFTSQMYNEIISALDQAAKDSSVLTVITGWLLEYTHPHTAS